MSRLRRWLLAAPATLAFLVPMSAAAASNRIFISTTGNNASDCSNPLTPCLDFTGALSQVNSGGEIIAEATVPYGPLNITKAVTISGPPGVVIFSGHQVTVNAPGATVVLRGLTIDGTGASENGIHVVAVGTLHVERCMISGFIGTGLASGNGIFFGSNGNLFVKDTTVQGNKYVAIWVHPASGTARASIDQCRIEGNEFGLIAHGNSAVTVRDTVASGTANAGFQADLGGELYIENCVAANNVIGIYSLVAGSVVRVSNTTVTDNGTGVLFSNDGAVLLSRGNNTVEGNGTDGAFSGTYSAK